MESVNREIILHLEDGSAISSYAKLDKAEQELPKSLFLRCHQSYMVSLYFVESMDRETFRLPGAEVPISRKYRKAAKEAYYEYMFDKL